MMDAKLERCKFGFENLLTSTRGHFNQSWIKWPRPTRAKKLGFARLDAITIEDIGIDILIHIHRPLYSP